MKATEYFNKLGIAGSLLRSKELRSAAVNAHTNAVPELHPVSVTTAIGDIAMSIDHLPHCLAINPMLGGSGRFVAKRP